MNLQNVLVWLRQPTTITGIGSLLGVVAGGLTSMGNGSATTSTVVGAVVFALVHLLINDNSAGAMVAAMAARPMLPPEPPTAGLVGNRPATLAVLAMFFGAGVLGLAGCNVQQMPAVARVQHDWTVTRDVLEVFANDPHSPVGAVQAVRSVERSVDPVVAQLPNIATPTTIAGDLTDIRLAVSTLPPNVLPAQQVAEINLAIDLAMPPVATPPIVGMP